MCQSSSGLNFGTLDFGLGLDKNKMTFVIFFNEGFPK